LRTGGYKTFGTEGQGNSTIGVKEDYSDTCSERVMLITFTAKKDTSTDDSEKSRRLASSDHPIVEAAPESSLVIELINGEFLSDLQIAEDNGTDVDPSAPVSSGIALKASTLIASIMLLIMGLY